MRFKLWLRALVLVKMKFLHLFISFFALPALPERCERQHTSSAGKSLLSHFASDRSGSISVAVAVSLLVFITLSAFTIETSYLFVVKLQTQRAADLATAAAANTASPVVSGAVSALAVATAQNMAAINGFGAANVSTTAAISPSGDGKYAVYTTINDTVGLAFTGGLTYGNSALVSSSSYAEVANNVTGSCIASVSYVINIYNSAMINGPNCTISSQNYLYICNTSSINVSAVTVNVTQSWESVFLCTSSSYTPTASSFTYNDPVTDNIASTASVVAGRSHLASLASGWPYGYGFPVATFVPNVAPGSNYTYTNTSAVLPQTTKYQNLTITNSTLTFSGSGSADSSCLTPTTIAGNVTLSGNVTITLNSGCYEIGGQISTNSGANVTIMPATGASVTLSTNLGITNASNATMSFGNMNLYPDGSITNNDGGTLTFGSGTFIIGGSIINGSGTLTFGNGPYYFNGGTIYNNMGTITFGNGPFYVWGGSINNYIGGTLTMGNGPYYMYGGSITTANGITTFGNGPFYMGGGSITLGLYSTNTFGSGNFDFYGGSLTDWANNFTVGNGGSTSSGSGTMTFYGGSMSINTGNFTSNGYSYFFSGGSVWLTGAGTLSMIAPTASSPTAGYANILFDLQYGLIAYYKTAATADVVSGVMHDTWGTIYVHLYTTASYPSGGCMSLAGNVVDIYENASLTMQPCGGLSDAPSQ